MLKISLQSVSKSYSGQEIFENLSLEIDSGNRLALVGPNGCGKSTLLKIIAGEIPPDFGKVHIPKGALLGYVAQELSSRDLQLPLEDFVLEVLPSWVDFWRQWRQAVKEGDQNKMQDLAHKQAELEHSFGYNPEHRAQAILGGLGFSEDKFLEPLQKLSGGWRERAKLARILVAGADVLFLDEPTNHLDLDAVTWLENYLLNYKGLLVFVAHDRIFLDRIANKVLYLGGAKPVLRSGNYSAFIAWQEEQDELLRKKTQRLQQDIAHKQSFVDRFGVKATKASQAQSRMVQIEKLQKQLAEVPQSKAGKQLTFSWPEPARGNKNVLAVSELTFSFSDGKSLFSSLSFTLYRGQKIVIVGPNGQGKSTLLKLIMKELSPNSGTITIGPGMKIGYFSQHQAEILNVQNSVLSEIRRLSDPATTEEQLRSVLGLFLLGPDFWEKKVGDLSGGEKSRLVMSSLFLSRANFLILDEPTNHLDMETREALIQALEIYSGTILVVAHDRYLLERVGSEVWELSDNGLDKFNLNFAQYWERKQQINSDKKQAVSKVPRQSSKQQKREQAELRNKIYKEIKPKKDLFAKLEQELENKLEEQEQVEALLADPQTYNQPQKLKELNLTYQDLQQQSEDIMTQLAFVEKEIQELEDKKQELLAS